MVNEGYHGKEKISSFGKPFIKPEIVLDNIKIHIPKFITFAVVNWQALRVLRWDCMNEKRFQVKL